MKCKKCEYYGDPFFCDFCHGYGKYKEIKMINPRKVETVELISCPMYGHCLLRTCITCDHFKGHYEATGYIDCDYQEGEEE